MAFLLERWKLFSKWFVTLKECEVRFSSFYSVGCSFLPLVTPCTALDYCGFELLAEPSFSFILSRDSCGWRFGVVIIRFSVELAESLSV